MKRKIVDQKRVVKARLVARGYKEKNEIQTDSPTAAKGTIRIFFAISGIKGWKCMTTDIKATILQGRNIECDVYMKPIKRLDIIPLYFQIDIHLNAIPDDFTL